MNRKNKLEESFLFEGFTVLDKQVFPLSANRRVFLRMMGNSICDGVDSDLDDMGEVAECLLACTLSPDELCSLREKDAWREKLSIFSISSPDGLIERFADEMLKEVERLKLSAVESLGKEEAQ